MYDGIIEPPVSDFIPPTLPPSQSVLCNDVTTNNYSSSNQPTNNVFETVGQKTEEISEILNLTKHSIVNEIIPTNLLSSFKNHVNKCTELQLENGLEVHIPTTKNPSDTISFDSETNSEVTVLCKTIETDISNSYSQEKESKKDNTSNDLPSCDSSNSNITLSEHSSTKPSNHEVCQLNSNLEKQETIADKKLTETFFSQEISPSSVICDNQQKPKRGISNEIKKFLENEKNIENEFTNFESKFRSLEIHSDSFDTEVSSEVLPTSPDFEPHLPKSFDDDMDDDFGNFENFDNLKSSENLDDFSDFKCSIVSEHDIIQNEVECNGHNCNEPFSDGTKLEALNPTEDVISTKDIELEFSEQNVCDSNEVVSMQMQTPIPPHVETLQPPLNIEEIHFVDKEDSFQTDFSQFESATIEQNKFRVELPEDVSIIQTNIKEESCSFDVATTSNENIDEDDDFGDFSNFTSVTENSNSSKTHLMPHITAVSHESSNTNDNTNTVTHDINDEFGEFTSEHVTPPPPSMKKFDFNTLHMTDLFESPAKVSHVLSSTYLFRM